MTILVTLHVLAAVVWVGGMFFADMVLRQSVGPLEPAVRLALWHGIFRRFFPWVWASIVLLLVSGYGMMFLYFGGCRRRAAYPRHAGHGHLDDAAVPASVLRTLAPT
jgi:uncharacterized membrane protein